MLTKIDLKALRTADQICFRLSNFSKDSLRRQHGTCRIEAKKDIENDPWQTEKYHFVDTDFHVYFYKSDQQVVKDKQCFFLLWNSRVWATIAKSLKEGDTLLTEWVCDVGDDLIRNSLTLVVQRQLPSGKFTTFEYLIGHDARQKEYAQYMMVPLITPEYSIAI